MYLQKKSNLVRSCLAFGVNRTKFILCSFILFSLCSISHSSAQEISPSNSVSTEPQTILVLGDSLSAAYNLNVNEGWVALLENTLKRTEKFSHYQVINASISGATTAAGLSVLPQLLTQHKPNLILLELGANDGLQGNAIPYIKNNLKRLIELCQQQNTHVLLIGIKLPPNYGSAYTKPFFEQYQDLATAYKLAYLPFLLEGVAGNSELMQADRLHPNAQAQTIILDNVWQILRPLLIHLPSE